MYTDASLKVVNCSKPETCSVVKRQQNKHIRLPSIDG